MAPIGHHIFFAIRLGRTEDGVDICIYVQSSADRPPRRLTRVNKSAQSDGGKRTRPPALSLSLSLSARAWTSAVTAASGATGMESHTSAKRKQQQGGRHRGRKTQLTPPYPAPALLTVSESYDLRPAGVPDDQPGVSAETQTEIERSNAARREDRDIFSRTLMITTGRGVRPDRQDEVDRR